MGQGKRKVLRFSDDDLEWIDPLINRWIKENEGKKQSDLILHLLKDFKLRSDEISRENESHYEHEHEDKQEYFTKIRKILNNDMDNFKHIVSRLQEKLRRMFEYIKSTAGTGVKTLGNKFKNLKSSVNDLFSGLKLETKDTRVEEIEAEVERLQNMVNELVRAQDDDTEELQSEVKAAAN